VVRKICIIDGIKSEEAAAPRAIATWVWVIGGIRGAGGGGAASKRPQGSKK